MLPSSFRENNWLPNIFRLQPVKAGPAWCCNAALLGQLCSVSLCLQAIHTAAESGGLPVV